MIGFYIYSDITLPYLCPFPTTSPFPLHPTFTSWLCTSLFLLKTARHILALINCSASPIPQHIVNTRFNNCPTQSDATLIMDVIDINTSSPNNGGPNVSRQLTPPDSPLPSIHAVLGSSKIHTRKMALDFIAPSNDSSNGRPTLPGLDCLSAAAALHRGSRPSTPLELPVLASHWTPPKSKGPKMNMPFNTPEQYEYRTSTNLSSPPEQYEYRASTNLPSPVWSSNSDLSDCQVYHLDPPLPQQSMLPPSSHSNMVSIPGPRSRSMTYLPTPPRNQANRLQKRSIQHHTESKLYTSSETMSSAHPARAERFPYDPEERYAIIHLRGLKNLKYEDTLLRFNFLFPPGQPRRCRNAVAKGLPPTYTPRNIQGLQCRWYRIRDEENLPKLRGSGVGGDRGRVEEVLGLMEREGEMGRGFAELVNTIAEMGNERLPRLPRMSI